MKNQDIDKVKEDCGDFCSDYYRDNTDGSNMCCYYGKGSAEYSGMTVYFEGCSVTDSQ